MLGLPERCHSCFLFCCSYFSCRDLTKLQAEVQAAGGKLTVKVDGQSVALELGKQFFFSAGARASAGKA